MAGSTDKALLLADGASGAPVRAAHGGPPRAFTLSHFMPELIQREALHARGKGRVAGGEARTAGGGEAAAAGVLSGAGAAEASAPELGGDGG